MWDYLISTLAIQHMSLDTFYTKHYLYQNYFRSHKTPRIHLKINTTSKHVKEKPGWLSRKRGGSRLSFRASNPKYHFHFFSFFKNQYLLSSRSNQVYKLIFTSSFIMSILLQRRRLYDVLLCIHVRAEAGEGGGRSCWQVPWTDIYIGKHQIATNNPNAIQ